MAFRKCQISFFNNILISTLAPCQQVGHAVCHLSFFRNWVDGRDHIKNDFKKSRTDPGAKSIQEPNREMAQNVGPKVYLRLLQLVHADICGPIKPISNGKKRYLITFTDDFTRKTWVYFLMEKSEALAIFKSFKIHVEKETNSFIGVLCTDRGGEFTSQEFINFCTPVI